MPHWLHILAVIWLVVAGGCALVVLVDELAGHAQHMWIMNVVWPVITLWAGPLGVLSYYRVGRLGTKRAARAAARDGRMALNKTKPFWQSVGVAATHCGSGCTVGDVIAECIVAAVPLTLFGSQIAGTWLADYIAAFVLGIVFQYFTIAPMKHLSPGKGLVAALRADALSLTAWQVGMYGWMALAFFVFLSPEALPKTEPAFWFMMQVAMIAGFLTSYPVNWWLLRKGIKEVM